MPTLQDMFLFTVRHFAKASFTPNGHFAVNHSLQQNTFFFSKESTQIVHIKEENQKTNQQKYKTQRTQTHQHSHTPPGSFRVESKHTTDFNKPALSLAGPDKKVALREKKTYQYLLSLYI